jgi:hypothetical protein
VIRIDQEFIMLILICIEEVKIKKVIDEKIFHDFFLQGDDLMK